MSSSFIAQVGAMYRAKYPFSIFEPSHADTKGFTPIISNVALGGNLLLIELRTDSLGVCFRFLHGLSTGWVRFGEKPEYYIEDWTFTAEEEKDPCGS